MAVSAVEAEAEQTVMDRGMLLKIRALAASGTADDAKLCEAQIDANAFIETEEKGAKGKGGSKGKGKQRNNGELPWRREEQPRSQASTEGGSGGTTGGDYVRRAAETSLDGGSGAAPDIDYPWRTERSSATRASPSASPQLGQVTPGDAAAHPWRKKSPSASPQLGPQTNHPWRKPSQDTPTSEQRLPSPSQLEVLPSPTLSEVIPFGDDAAPSEEMPESAPFAESLGIAAAKAAAEAFQKDDGKTEIEKEEATTGVALPEYLASVEPENSSDDDDEVAELGEAPFSSEIDVVHFVSEFDEGRDEAQPFAGQEDKTGSEKWKGGSGGGWKAQPVKLPSDLVVGPAPPPPLHALAGTWLDTLGNVIQVPLFPAVAWFTSHSGSSQHELTLDKWGRLWCGNGVLNQVGYCGGPLAQDMPPSHLSWRTTAWKFSMWQRVEAPPAPVAAVSAAPTPSGRVAARERGRGKGRAANNKGGKAPDEAREAPGKSAPPPKPQVPKLGDFMSFPALGGKESKSKKAATRDEAEEANA